MTSLAPWRIGAARYDPATKTLTVNGAVVALEHRAVALLGLLLARPGDVVSKTDIMDALWPDRSVSEASLVKCISRLRMALGDEDHALVCTVHGVGYRIEGASREPAPPPALVEPAAGPVLPAPAERGTLRRRAWLGIGLICASLGFSALGWQRARGPAHRPSEAARALYLKGLQDWAQRTPASLNAAEAEMKAAIAADPDYAEAYVGLANCYNLLREFALMPSVQAYTLAKAAASRAIALKPDLALAHAAYAFDLFYGDWNFAGGLAEFERALQLEPGNATIHHWTATALSANCRFAEALAQINRAMELEPGSLSIRADRGAILLDAGQTEEARRVLTALAADAPGFLSPHHYLAKLALMTGDDAAYLREISLAANLRHDGTTLAIANAAKAGYAASGHAGFLNALLAARLEAFSAGALSAMEVASAYALLGDRRQAWHYVNVAIDRHDELAIYLREPGFDKLRSDPESAQVAARLRVNLPSD